MALANVTAKPGQYPVLTADRFNNPQSNIELEPVYTNPDGSPRYNGITKEDRVLVQEAFDLLKKGSAMEQSHMPSYLRDRLGDSQATREAHMSRAQAAKDAVHQNAYSGRPMVYALAAANGLAAMDNKGRQTRSPINVDGINQIGQLAQLNLQQQWAGKDMLANTKNNDVLNKYGASVGHLRNQSTSMQYAHETNMGLLNTMGALSGIGLGAYDYYNNQKPAGAAGAGSVAVGAINNTPAITSGTGGGR